MRMWKRGMWTGAVLTCLAGGAAHGALVAGDHFNLSTPAGTQLTDQGLGVYTNGSSLTATGPAVTGFNSGTNWSTTQSGSAITPNAAGLTYSDSLGNSLTTSGGMVQYTGPSTALTSLDRYSRVTNISAAAVQTTYYASVLIDVSSFSLPTNQALMELKFGSSAYVQFGLRNSNAVIFNTTGGSLGGSDTPVAATTSGAYAANQTHLLVLKIVGQVGGNDSVSLFIDPTDLTTESGTPLTVTNGLNLLSDAGDKLSLWAIDVGKSLGTSNFADVDEMRVGTSWADVVPVPEPTSIGMLASACSAALLIRRRRTGK